MFLSWGLGIIYICWKAEYLFTSLASLDMPTFLFLEHIQGWYFKHSIYALILTEYFISLKMIY